MDMEERLRKFELTVFNPPVDYEYLKKELANGLDLNEIDPPILFAAKDYESTIFLLENGADPNKFLGWKNINDRDNMSSSFQILSYNKYKKKEEHYKVIKLAIEKGANVNYKDAKGLTALDFAMRTGDKKLIELLKSYGAEIGNPDFTKGVFIGKLKPNPFDEEIYLDDKVEIIEEFINNGYDVNAIYLVDSIFNEQTLLNYAVYYQSFYRYKNSCNITELILKNGAKPNFYLKNSSYYTQKNPPLHNAIQSIYENFYAYAIPWKDDNDIDEDSITSTPTEVIELLIKYGADVNLKNSDDYTPLDLAIENKNPWAEEILTKNGAKHSDKYLSEEKDWIGTYHKFWKKHFMVLCKSEEIIYNKSINSAFVKIYYEGADLSILDLPEIHKIVLFFNYKYNGLSYINTLDINYT